MLIRTGNYIHLTLAGVYSFEEHIEIPLDAPPSIVWGITETTSGNVVRNPLGIYIPYDTLKQVLWNLFSKHSYDATINVFGKTLELKEYYNTYNKDALLYRYRKVLDFLGPNEARIDIVRNQLRNFLGVSHSPQPLQSESSEDLSNYRNLFRGVLDENQQGVQKGGWGRRSLYNRR